MWIFISIILLVCVCLLFGQLLQVKAICNGLAKSLQEKRLLLIDGKFTIASKVGLDILIREVNQLNETHRKMSDVQSGYSGQVEATLASIPEAVLIYDKDHVIEFANEPARRYFQRGRALKGAQLESILRAPELIEFLNQAGEFDLSETQNHLKIGEGDDSFWFELSRSDIVGISGPKSKSTLLVLHDVTRLKGLEMARRDFVANVSHELRTPLTIIKGFAETLVDDNEVLPVDARARFLGKIVNNAERLNILVEDLLTLSRLESKPEQITANIQSLKVLFEDSVETFSGRIDSTKQSIKIEFSEEVEDFAFDRFRINQVVDNLFENAFRYAPNFGLIVLGARLNVVEGTVECWFSDDGPGIPEKDLPHLFERFYRVDKGRSRDRGGTGLGLSIMKHIVQQHGGTVRVESQEEQGATFWFSLPYKC